MPPKRVWFLCCFGLKMGQDLENRAAHPQQKLRGVLSQADELVCFYSGYGRQDGKAAITKINFSCLRMMRVTVTSEKKWWDSIWWIHYASLYEQVCYELETNSSGVFSYRLTLMWKDFAGFCFIIIKYVVIRHRCSRHILYYIVVRRYEFYFQVV